MDRFLTSNDTLYRLARTILQGVLGVVIANLDFIIGFGNFSAGTKALIVALVMATLSPIMSELGKYIESEEYVMEEADEYDDEESDGGIDEQ